MISRIIDTKIASVPEMVNIDTNNNKAEIYQGKKIAEMIPTTKAPILKIILLLSISILIRKD